MARVTIAELAAVLDKLQQQMADISCRLEKLEGGKGGAVEAAAPAQAVEPALAAVPAAAAAAVEAAPAVITEEELLAVAAAIGAFLGVKAHIRQIRLISTAAWAQQGRVSIQASHRLA
jgi:methylmalonyl-CoA carboxyltransferase 12S subunit